MIVRRLFGLLLGLVLSTGLTPSAQAQAAPGPSATLAELLNRGKWGRADVERARVALRQGASLRTRSRRGVNVLMFAARTADLSLMRAVLRAGVDVNAQTSEGLSALWYVMATRNADTLRFLLEQGARPDLVEVDGRTPLMLAVHFKFRRGIELLLARGADVNARNEKGYTALAYTDAHPGITSLLRERGGVD